MLVHKWSHEVSFEKKTIMRAISGPRSALDHRVSHWSLVPQQSLSATQWHESGKLTYCRALLLLLPETMESKRYQQSLSPGRTQIRSYCSKLNPSSPPFREPQRNTQAYDATTHLICNRRRIRECAYTTQPRSADDYSWLWLQAQITHLSSLSELKLSKEFNFHRISPPRQISDKRSQDNNPTCLWR